MSFFSRIFRGKNHEQKGDDILLQLIKEECTLKSIQSEIINQELVICDYKIFIKARIANKTQHPNAMVAQLDFIIQQENFDTGILESLAGIGKANDINGAIKNGVAAFVSNILAVIIESFYDKHDPELDFETNLGGNAQLWHPNIGALHTQGYCDINNVDANRIFNILKDEIIPRLGTKRFYWIKVYVSRQQDGKIITQCTLNNEQFFKAQQIVQEYAQGWNIGKQFKGEKQFIILRQCDKTWKQGKYNYENLKKHVFGAMELFEECTTQAEYDLLFERIAKLTGDIQLAFEIYTFIPEICCEITLPEIKYYDEIVLLKPDGSRTNIFVSQISNLTIIKKLVREKMQLGLDKDKYNRILFLSSTFKAIHSALLKGSKLENLVILPLAVNVAEDYNPYR